MKDELKKQIEKIRNIVAGETPLRLSDCYVEQVVKFAECVHQTWEGNDIPPFYTLHNLDHNIMVLEVLCKLLLTHTSNSNDLLKPTEKYILVASALFHDVGMIKLDNIPQVQSPEQIRSNHHRRSAQWVLKQSRYLELNIAEASAISQVICYHRNENVEEIEKCPDFFLVGSDLIRTRLLAAYLRIADALHQDHSRAPEKEFSFYQMAGMPTDAKFHWIKARAIQGIHIDNSKRAIDIIVRIPEDSAAEDFRPLQEFVKQELEDELESARPTLASAGQPIYLGVESKCVKIPGLLKDSDSGKEIVELNNLISIDVSPNARMFTDVVLKCITQLSSSNGFSDKDILGSLESLRDYAKDMVGKVITRRCHVAVIRLFVNLVKLLKGEELVKETNLSDLVREETSTTLEKRLSTVIGEIQFYDSSDTQESRQQKLQNIRKYFTEEQQKLDQIRKNLINNGENILDENILKPNDRILLYGHSQSVIDMLSGCAKKNSDYYKNLGIFIAECRPKAKHTRANKIEYNDGLEYASKLCRCGYENVVIVPDVAIAHLCISKKNYPPAKSIKTSRKNERKQWFHAEEPVTKIFLGFNGLDIHNNFMIHTCGHLAAVMMAKSDKSEAKVYLVGTSNKCGNVPYDHLKTRDESNWLLVPPDIKSSINLYNPSEDIITFDLVDGIISDIGIFYGEDWSKKFVDEFNKGWENG